MSSTGQFPIVDSHIHLFPATHLKTLSWHSDSNPLGKQHSIDEYKQATKTNASALRGFIFLETDRLSSVTESPTSNFTSTPVHGWTHALDEVSLLTRIALGEPIAGEGHSPEDKELCWGIIPWAPIPGGQDVLEQYLDLVRERVRMGEVWAKVRGVRYLVQDKPAGTMLQDGFVGSLKCLGRLGLTFDLGVDARSGGLGQLREAVEMMGRVYEGVTDGREAVTIIINHMCKPNLRLPPASVRSHPEFLEWRDLITKMARAHPKTYMKLSGAFSEIEPLDGQSEPDFEAIVERVQPWTNAVFDAFGAERVMYGSDWPVCNVGGGGNDVSWGRWRRVVEEILERRGLSDKEKGGVWAMVAIDAYKIGYSGVRG